MDFPHMVRIRQSFQAPTVVDVAGTVRGELHRAGLADKIRPGFTVAIGVGSRGISSIAAVSAAIVSELKGLRARPFIVPAMGSHGSGTAEGQLEVLRSLGVSEDTVGAPIRATMEVKEIGRLESGMPVYLDRYACEADAIIVVNRVKPHMVCGTRIGSGIMKIIAIGLGKQKGCNTLHDYAFGNPSGPYELIETVARASIARLPIVLGVGIIDNAYGMPARIVALEARDIPELEPALLREARSLMPNLPVGNLDVLIVEKMGKNVSSSGFDYFVVGDRIYGDRKTPPFIKRLVVLDLTEQSHGNAIGIAAADLTTQRLFDKIDRKATYLNCISSSRIESAKIPMVMPTDRDAIEVALRTIGRVEPPEARVIRIASTARLGEMDVSASLLDEVAGNPRVQVIGGAVPMFFDETGNLA